MITAAIISLVQGLVNGILGLVPEWSINMSAVTGFTGNIGSTIGRMNGYVPSTLLFSCLSLLMVMKLALLAWRTVVFIYSMVPLN